MGLYSGLVVLTGTLTVAGDEAASFDKLGEEFHADVRPLLKRSCLQCHSTRKKKGDLDLEQFATLAEVRRATKVWVKVAEMLDNGEMPPEDAEAQLTTDERKDLRAWLERYLHAEALASAGDPGPVVMRRLTNAEYTYTIRDLTEVELDPAREFPSEGAAGEGFTNTGNALVMSPALLRKYLDAGKEVAAHAVLLPDGFRFSAHTTPRDWTDEILARIREFYARFSKVERLAEHYGNNLAHLGKAGRLPLEKYFVATIAERDSLSRGEKTPAAVAAQHGLNARYLQALWSTLNSDDRSLLLDELRVRWREAGPGEAAALAAQVNTWQKGLWIFNPVGLLGRKGSQARWLEPVDPLLTRQELRLKVPGPKSGEEATEFTVSLIATDAGDGNDHDFLVWERPRLIAEKMPDILLRDVEGIDAALFGRHPEGKKIDSASICVRAPATISLRLPAELAGRELVTTAALDPETGSEGSVQGEMVAGTPEPRTGLLPSEVVVGYDKINIGAEQRTVTHRRAILIGEKGGTRQRFEEALEEHRSLFPAALCYTQIVPVDEFLTLTLLYREDDQLVRLMLDDKQKAHLDELWNQLRYVSEEPLRLVDVLDSLLETTIDHPQAGIFDDAVESFNARAETFKKMVVNSEAAHLDALTAFAARAWRRPLTASEKDELGKLYRELRKLELPHQHAFRLTLARLFVASPFLYRLEEAPEGAEAAPVTPWELANRLSYFLWSSLPDDELRAVAADGTLPEPAVLAAQARRLLSDSRARRLATEFACQWLHIHNFDTLIEKSAEHFPGFAELRADFYEESILFLSDLFQHDRSLLDLLDADHTFANERLAQFYGLPRVKGDDWRRVKGIRQHGRGGILGLATTLATQSGATRTSPILRGNWISEVLLGEKLPRPPKNVPQLADALPEGLTERQLMERHSNDAACAKCHARIDPFGFALENFDAIGRRREKDAGGLAIDSRTTLPDGTRVEGLSGLRDYLLGKRRDAFLRQFCRKLLGYALGRELQLSDQPLLDEMMARLAEHDYRFSVAVETIVLSKQFRMIRGRTSQ